MLRNKPLQNIELGKDILWKHSLPISLDFEEGSRLVLNERISSLENREVICIIDITDNTNLFSCLLPERNFKRIWLWGNLYKSTPIGSSYYFPYKAGFNRERDFIENIGNVEILVNPSLTDPHYVLTGAMNGCAIIITKEEGQNIDGNPSFRAWHFQSPTSYRNELKAFIKRYRNSIYTYICFRDYASPNNGPGYDDGEIEGFNYLFFNKSIYDKDNECYGTWELNCIPLKRMPLPPGGKWGKPWVAKSNHPKSIRFIDFTEPIAIPPDTNEGECPVIDWIIWDIIYAVEKLPQYRDAEPEVDGELPKGLPPKTFTKP